MRKNLLALSMCATMIACAILANATPSMVASYQYGNSMGSASGVTAKSISLYDSQNKVIRSYNLATDLDNVTFVEDVTFYNYDEEGKLVEKYNRQYRPAYGDWVDGERDVYTYDEQGRLVKIVGDNRSYEYIYNEQGYLQNEKYLSTTTDQTIQDITYFDFDGNGNPARSESNGYQSDYRFTAVYTYDELGRCVDDLRHCLEGTMHSRIVNTYDAAGVLTETYTYMSAYGKGGREKGEVGGVKDTLNYDQHIVRNNIGNGWYEKTAWTWDKILKMFTTSGSPFHELYVNLDGAYAPRNAAVENISTPEQPNTVKVTADVPATLPGENMSYIIWRSGNIAGIVEAVDGKIQFVDAAVANGTYEYIVQTYDAVNDVYYNCSDIVVAEIIVPLTPAENLRVVGGYHGTYSDPQVGDYSTFYVKLQWDVQPCDATILGYKVWVCPWAYPMLEIEGDVRNCELSMVDDEVANIRVDVVYDYGVKEGDYLPLFWDNSKDFEGEPDVTYYLSYEKGYGDHMGTPGASSITYYIYDNNNNLSRRIDYGYQTDGSKVPTYHYFYEYNRNGQIISEFYRQMNSLGEWGKNKMPRVYTYDQMGRLITKEDTLSKTLWEYSYDLVGNLSIVTEKGRSYGSTEYDVLRNTTTYSQYDTNGKPGYSEYVHAQYASSSYNTTYTYDSKGRILVQESRYPDGTAYEKLEYTYDQYGVITSMVRSGAEYDEVTYQRTERFLYTTRTIREPQGGMVYKRYDENYQAKTASWTDNGRFTMETYSPLNSKLTPQNLSVKDASTASSPNTIEIECNFPQVKLAGAQYVIWRGWIPVDTVEATAAQGIIRFRDVNVENGTYEYIVQTYDAYTGQSFNATAPILFTLEARLDPVQNLQYTGTTEGVYYDADLGEMPVYWVHFAWEAPDSPLEIVAYNVYQDGFRIPISTTTNTCDSVWVYREDEANKANQTTTTSVEVKVLYTLGESQGVSETFILEVNACDNVTLEGTAYVAAKTLYTEPNASVVVYNTAGAVVAAYNNKQQIDLANMPAGVYIVVVTVGNNSQILKVAL